ncbi:HAMP domain-containing protein [Agathobaculum sp. NSJ-28]|uniref:histidine kinase n=1 Tax=Agathobaculum faecis TaxID=2763013 RepID=A0A923RV07_9FIRM|nr:MULTISPECIES: ATP-binding protein [Butyricicoccaceae]MBC5724439.1 HAMP domain-containing protein [Agathobaculum faecis]MBS6881826.1 HAMP domain-containing protein [Clostridiaceae bacterium]WOC75211.1 ATP-binding protein [Intestinibacillus sp. NTUH-41-i26]
MFRSLHMKLVLILVLMIVSVMAVVGTFLINSVSTFYIDSFYEDMQNVFNQTDVMQSLENAAQAGTTDIQTVVDSYEGQLGIDNYRTYYILDSQGRVLASSNALREASFTRTSNVIAAMAGETGTRSSVADSVMDVAVPIRAGDGDQVDYIVYIADDKREVSDMSWRFFQIVMQAMMFGLLAAILLSFLLSKTITTPIERITEGARSIAKGNFDQELGVQSSDEIGELTRSFNYMAGQLKNTVGEVQGERDKLNTLFLHMTDGVAAFTTAGRLIHMNPATESLLGVRVEDGLTFDEMFADLDMPNSDETAMRSFLTSEITRFGRVLSVTLAPYGALDGEGGVIAVIHDITEQRRLDDARREFVANVSHELRTPLTNIRSYTETLLDAAGDIPIDTEKQFLGVISSESERMARIVTDLLTLSKLDYGRMELRMTRFPLGDMLKNVANAMKFTAEDSGHELTVDTPDDLPQIVGDRERIEQVVVNILSNAVKYTPAGGHVRLSARMAGANRVRITVEDDGVGIPAADVPRLFERFYRVDKARSREAGGTGLGLAIAKEIVEQHEGKIALASEYGKGTTVTITLPTDLIPNREEGPV